MEPKFEIHDQEWAKNLQQGLEEYMMGLYNSVDEDGDPETESGLPFCGCDVCNTRETMAYLTPRIIAGYDNAKVSLV